MVLEVYKPGLLNSEGTKQMIYLLTFSQLILKPYEESYVLCPVNEDGDPVLDFKQRLEKIFSFSNAGLDDREREEKVAELLRPLIYSLDPVKLASKRLHMHLNKKVRDEDKLYYLNLKVLGLDDYIYNIDRLVNIDRICEAL